MEQPVLVSILIPIYNVGQYLPKMLHSVFTQTYPYLEFVFVNDCSTDDSLQVLKEVIAQYGIADNRITIVNHGQNEGIAVSRTDCIAHARGTYVYFVDSDDWIEPDAVEQMVAATGNGMVDIVGCDYMKDFADGTTTYHRENYADTCRENMLRCLNYDVATVLWKLLIRRSLFDHFSIMPHLNIGEDYVISVKLFYYAQSFVALHVFAYHYVQYNQSRLSNQLRRSINDHIRCVQEVQAFLKEKGIDDRLVEHLLLLRKFNIKSNFLTKQSLDYDAYRNTFPEANHIWREMGYTKNERLKFWLAEHGLFMILRLIQRQ